MPLMACIFSYFEFAQIDRVQSHMVDLARKIAAGSRSPKLVNLEEELRQSPSEKFAEYEKLGSDVRNHSLLAVPVDVSVCPYLRLLPCFRKPYFVD